jgi:hypothetical protein
MQSETVITDPEPYPVAFLRISRVELEPKSGWTRPSVKELRNLLGLQDHDGGLDADAQEDLEELEGWRASLTEKIPNPSSHFEAPAMSSKCLTPPCLVQRGRWFSISAGVSSIPGETVGEELQRSFEAISGKPTHYDRHGSFTYLAIRSSQQPRPVLTSTLGPCHSSTLRYVTLRLCKHRIRRKLRHVPP